MMAVSARVSLTGRSHCLGGDDTGWSGTVPPQRVLDNGLLRREGRIIRRLEPSGRFSYAAPLARFRSDHIKAVAVSTRLHISLRIGDSAHI
jgi:hypothetical protein